jgi:hypothetical protein
LIKVSHDSLRVTERIVRRHRELVKDMVDGCVGCREEVIIGTGPRVARRAVRGEAPEAEFATAPSPYLRYIAQREVGERVAAEVRRLDGELDEVATPEVPNTVAIGVDPSRVSTLSMSAWLPYSWPQIAKSRHPVVVVHIAVIVSQELNIAEHEFYLWVDCISRSRFAEINAVSRSRRPLRRFAPRRHDEYIAQTPPFPWRRTFQP